MQRLSALLVVPLLVLTACGGDGEQQSGAPEGNGAEKGGAGSAAPEAGSSGEGLAGVQVSGGAGEPPKVQVEKGFSVDQTTTEVVSEGGGSEVTAGATVLVNYVAVNGANGQTFDNSYRTGRPQTFPLVEQQMFPGIIESLVGKQTGDRVTAAIPPEQLFGQQGNPQAKVGADDTVVFVFDIEKTSDPEPRESVQGDSAELPASLPQLQLDDSGTPTGFEPGEGTAAAPDELGVHTLVEGDGDPVRKGDLLTAHYLGQIYPDGKIFDQSYTRGSPATFQVGVGSLIPAWDKALVGVKEGSRVVLVVPPKEGYGAQGQPQAGIKGDDTLIFVVDVLGVS